MDRDADLNTPATTPSGSLDGMVVSHLTGRGAAELVRFWGEPPLVREPDLALFGTARIEPAEEGALRHSPLRSYPASEIQRKGAAAAAEEAVERVHANAREFILHFDVDVIAGFLRRTIQDRTDCDAKRCVKRWKCSRSRSLSRPLMWLPTIPQKIRTEAARS